MAYTTRTIVAGTKEERGDRFRIVVAHSGNAGESVLNKEYFYADDEDLKRQALAVETKLNAVAVIVSGQLGAPSTQADPAGPMRAFVTAMHDISRRQRELTDISAVTGLAGGAATNFTAVKTDMQAKIVALATQAGTTYAAATNPQKSNAMDNL